MASVPNEKRGITGQAGAPAITFYVGHVYLDLRRRRLRYLNSVARQLHSEGVPFTAADLRGQRLFSLDGEVLAGGDLPLLAAWREQRPVTLLFVLPRDGETIWRVSWTATPVRNKRGRIVGIFGSVACLPPEPNWNMLAELAHDLRTPLHSFKLLCALLEQLPQVDPRVHQIGETLRGAGERAMAIALELLEYCRGPAQRRHLQSSSWFAIEPFLVSLVQELALGAQRKGLVLAPELASVRDWEVHTDPVRFGRILSNLLVNAIRYTSSGQVALRASWREQPVGKSLVLSVVDTGPGLFPEEQESIFQGFERGRVGKEGDSGGSGLGLAVVDRLVQELGLTLAVHSEYGQGSDFQLVMPLALLRRRPES